jgi:hypothetical protein
MIIQSGTYPWNERPRSFAISERSIDCASASCAEKFKPVASGQNQTATDMRSLFPLEAYSFRLPVHSRHLRGPLRGSVFIRVFAGSIGCGSRAEGTGMQRRRLLLCLTLAAAAVVPAFAQTVAGEPLEQRTQSATSIPDFSGIWWHPSLPGFEPLASGPTSVINRSRRNGVSNYDELVGDYANPILKPEAAEVVKRHGEISLSGVTYPNPANQCWPEPVPFIYKNFALLMLQAPDHITMLYEQDHEVRHVRMNQQHPANLTPSWYGDSVGHYEGDTLVIDTVGIKSDRKFAMLDLYGTPYTKALHVVERYRLIDYEAAKDGLERDRKENQKAGGGIDRNFRGMHLQVVFTVEDRGVFTTPWTATITYGRGSDAWPEVVCAENPHEYYNNQDSEIPTADKSDF